MFICLFIVLTITMGAEISTIVRIPTDDEFRHDKPFIRTYTRHSNTIGQNSTSIISRACDKIRNLLEDNNMSEFKIVERADAPSHSPFNDIFGGRQPIEVIREIITKKGYINDVTVTEKYTFKY